MGTGELFKRFEFYIVAMFVSQVKENKERKRVKDDRQHSHTRRHRPLFTGTAKRNAGPTMQDVLNQSSLPGRRRPWGWGCGTA
jgi:hypothetical protein